jgi:hypothetical protein
MFKRMNDIVKYAVFVRSLCDKIEGHEPEWIIALREKLGNSMLKHRNDFLRK